MLCDWRKYVLYLAYLCMAMSPIFMTTSCSKESVNHNENKEDSDIEGRPTLYSSYKCDFPCTIQSTSFLGDTIIQFCDGGYCLEFDFNDVSSPIFSYELPFLDGDNIHCSTSHVYVDGTDTLYFVKGIKFTSQIYVYLRESGEFKISNIIYYPVIGYLPNFALDTEQSILYALTYTKNTYLDSEDNAIRVSMYPYYGRDINQIGPLLDSFILPFVPVAQDTFYDNGKLYLAYGDPYTKSSGILIVDVESREYRNYNLRKYLSPKEEPEGIFCYHGDIYVVTVLGNIYVVKLENEEDNN